MEQPRPRPKRVSRASIARSSSCRRRTRSRDRGRDPDDKPAKERPAPAKSRTAAHEARQAAVADARPRPARRALYAQTRPARRPAPPAARSSSPRPSYKPSADAALKLNRRDYVAKKMRKGARVIAGTILGRIGKTSEDRRPHVLFEIRPAGRGAPRIDPKPILDGWKLLESTEIYRAAGKNPFFGPDAKTPSIGQILLMSKQALQEHMLVNPRIEIYGCGRRDIRIGGDRPPRAGDARVPRRVRPEAERQLAAVRPQPLHRLGQHLRALVRQRRGHRRHQRHHRSPPPPRAPARSPR